MKILYKILGIVILTATLFYVWTKAKKQDQQAPENVRSANEKFEIMEIKRTDIEQTKDIDDIVHDLVLKYYPDYDDDSFNKLDLVTQTFALIVDADGQIQNGGIMQFIDNGTGNRFHETVDAAKRISNDSLVAILTKATTQYPNGQIPKNWDSRRDLWAELCEEHENDENWITFWDKLDDSYYNNSKVIYQNLIDYLKSNAKLID